MKRRSRDLIEKVWVGHCELQTTRPQLDKPPPAFPNAFAHASRVPVQFGWCTPRCTAVVLASKHMDRQAFPITIDVVTVGSQTVPSVLTCPSRDRALPNLSQPRVLCHATIFPPSSSSVFRQHCCRLSSNPCTIFSKPCRCINCKGKEGIDPESNL